jgi:hypothetical protein
MLKGFVNDFKAFAVKGNAIDMAVGIVVGAAFNKVVNSIVTDLLMPPLGMAIGGVDFKELRWVLQPAKAAADAAPAVAEVPLDQLPPAPVADVGPDGITVERLPDGSVGPERPAG